MAPSAARPGGQLHVGPRHAG